MSTVAVNGTVVSKTFESSRKIRFLVLTADRGLVTTVATGNVMRAAMRLVSVGMTVSFAGKQDASGLVTLTRLI